MACHYHSTKRRNWDTSRITSAPLLTSEGSMVTRELHATKISYTACECVSPLQWSSLGGIMHSTSLSPFGQSIVQCSVHLEMSDFIANYYATIDFKYNLHLAVAVIALPSSFLPSFLRAFSPPPFFLPAQHPHYRHYHHHLLSTSNPSTNHRRSPPFSLPPLDHTHHDHLYDPCYASTQIHHTSVSGGHCG